LRRSRPKIILLYFTPRFAVYTELGIDPDVIVQSLDKILYTLKLFSIEHLDLQSAKEILHSSIVHAVSFSGHALSNVVFSQ